MSKISYFDLISGQNIPFNDVCTLRPPKLCDIAEIGYRTYDAHLMLLTIGLEKYLEISNLQSVYEKFSEEEKQIYTLFPLIVVRSDTRELLRETLCFFIAERLVFNEHRQGFFVVDDADAIIGVIDESNFDEIKNAILQLNYITADDSPPPKHLSARQMAIYEKIQIGKKEAAKTKKADGNMSLPNLISSVSAHHNSYNLTNIWSLTVYQLYDQFFKLNNKVQLEVIGTRWAAWGKEDFDFSIWYKDLNLKT